MSAERTSELFEPNEALESLNEHARWYGPDEQTSYFALRSLMMLPSHLGPFEIACVKKGCTIVFFGKRCEFELRLVEVKEDRSLVALSAQPLSDKAGRARARLFEGWGDEPEVWLSIIRTITRCEGLTLFMHDWPGHLRAEWAEYERIRGDRLGF
jgi:hypothetical protein